METFHNLSAELNAEFKEVCAFLKDSTEESKFVQVFRELIEEKSKEANMLLAHMAELGKEHDNCCDMWRIKESDDKRKEPITFIKFFH